MDPWGAPHDVSLSGVATRDAAVGRARFVQREGHDKAVVRITGVLAPGFNGGAPSCEGGESEAMAKVGTVVINRFLASRFLMKLL